jgi:hypothetical protein
MVRFPEAVGQALVVFGPLFQNRRQRQHPGEYLAGLTLPSVKPFGHLAVQMLNLQNSRYNDN